MDTLEAILTRRSVRHFSRDPLPEKELQILLRAAMQAPSARNLRPWHFVVIQDPALLQEVPKFHPSARFVPEAAAAILICADETVSSGLRWVQDCSAAAQNLLLAAHARGLGACWVGIQPEQVRIEGMRRLCALPETIQPLCLVALGYPAEAPQPVDRFMPERVHHERW